MIPGGSGASRTSAPAPRQSKPNRQRTQDNRQPRTQGRSIPNTGGGLTAQQVIDRAMQIAESGQDYSGLCQKFVRLAFGSAGGAPTAVAAWQQTPDKHTNGQPPPGAAVYFGGGDGHAAISLGDGRVLSTDVNGGIGVTTIQDIMDRWGKQYLGWSSQTNEKRITTFNAKPVNRRPVTVNSAAPVRRYPTQDNGGGLTGPGDAKTNQTADYGWSDAVFNSNPELRALLKQAKANDWDAQTMQAAIRGTDWYRQHAASWRKAWVTKRDNPEEFQRQVTQARSSVDAIANEFGVTLSDAERNKIAHDYLWLGLDQTELNDAVGSYFKATQGTPFTGTAGDLQDKVNEMAASYGVKVSQDWVGRFVKGMLTGQRTEQDAQNYLAEMAKSAYPTLAPHIDQGMTVADIAHPYIQAMSNLLEIPDTQIDLFDPNIRQALSATGKDGTPQMKPIWQFESDIRKDPRWLQTNNARDTLLNVGSSIARSWGLA